MVSYTSFFTYNVYFKCVWRIEKTVFKVVCIKAGYHLYPSSRHLFLSCLLNKWSWKMNHCYFFCANLLKKNNHVRMTRKDAYINKKFEQHSHSSTFLLKESQFLQLPAFYLNEKTPKLATYLLLWTNSLVATMRTLENAKTVLVNFVGQNWNWLQKLGCKTQNFKKSSEQRLPPGPKNYNGEIRFQLLFRLRNQLVLERNTSAETKNCPPNRLQQCPKIQRNNSSLFRRRLTFWTVVAERFVWICCGTVRRMWTSQRVSMLKHNFLKEKNNRESFNKFSI